jgi:hypothetical protein
MRWVQLVEEFLARLQVGGAKSFGEPLINRRQQIARLTDIIVRVTPASWGSRIDLRSSSRYGRSDFGVNAARIRDYLTALRAATTSQG